MVIFHWYVSSPEGKQKMWVLDGIGLLCPLRSSFQLSHEEYLGCLAGWCVIVGVTVYYLVILGLLQISITYPIQRIPCNQYKGDFQRLKWSADDSTTSWYWYSCFPLVVVAGMKFHNYQLFGCEQKITRATWSINGLFDHSYIPVTSI
jgi:hypothetical protein